MILTPYERETIIMADSVDEMERIFTDAAAKHLKRQKMDEAANFLLKLAQDVPKRRKHMVDTA